MSIVSFEFRITNDFEDWISRFEIFSASYIFDPCGRVCSERFTFMKFPYIYRCSSMSFIEAASCNNRELTSTCVYTRDKLFKRISNKTGIYNTLESNIYIYTISSAHTCEKNVYNTHIKYAAESRISFYILSSTVAIIII